MLSSMSVTGNPLHLLPIKYLPCSGMKIQTYAPSQISANGFLSFSSATATCALTQRIQFHSRRSLRTEAGGSHGEPQDTSHTKADDPTTTIKQGGSRSNSNNSVLSFLCPLLKFVGGKDPSLPRSEIFEGYPFTEECRLEFSMVISGAQSFVYRLHGGLMDMAFHKDMERVWATWSFFFILQLMKPNKAVTSGLASISRLPWGSKALPDAATVREEKGQPMRLLQLYEFEACPFCRRVREALTELDLPAEVYPCPKGSLKHRDLVRRSGGKEQFPYLVDPNTGVSLYESGDIVRYLFRQYGGGRDPSLGLLESTLFTGWVPTIIRAGRGMTLWERAKPEMAAERLELFSYENNQNARLVREALCELELPYILHNVGKGSSKILILLQLAGSDKVPYLVDPNTGVSLGNPKEIISYLFQTYSSR